MKVDKVGPGLVTQWSLVNQMSHQQSIHGPFALKNAGLNDLGFGLGARARTLLGLEVVDVGLEILGYRLSLGERDAKESKLDS